MVSNKGTWAYSSMKLNSIPLAPVARASYFILFYYYYFFNIHINGIMTSCPCLCFLVCMVLQNFCWRVARLFLHGPMVPLFFAYVSSPSLFTQNCVLTRRISFNCKSQNNFVHIQFNVKFFSFFYLKKSETKQKNLKFCGWNFGSHQNREEFFNIYIVGLKKLKTKIWVILGKLDWAQDGSKNEKPRAHVWIWNQLWLSLTK